MRVLFSSTRGAGHLQPLLPYARALVSRGHEVLVAGPDELAEPLRAAQLAHAPFDHPGDAVLAPFWARLREAPKAESQAVAMRDIFAGANARAALPRLRETIEAWKPGLIVRDSVEFGSLVAADRAGVPHARVAVHLVSFEEPTFHLAATSVDQLRHTVDLPPEGAAFVHAEPAFSAFPASMDGPLDAAVIRAPFRSRTVDAMPNPTAGIWHGSYDQRPLVYVTFGTIAGGTPHVRAVYRTAMEALATLPVRALLTTGRDLPADALGTVPSNVHVEVWVPQRDVLPHVGAVVCHGGSGTVVGSLAAGVPLVVVPLFADQPYNAQRVAAVGAGLAVPGATPAALGDAITRVLTDSEFRQGARRVADEIAAMPTIDSAIDVLLALGRAT
jgi:UDP:flavonoid glycosyltransferase YjiC (YdhE family)